MRLVYTMCASSSHYKNTFLIVSKFSRKVSRNAIFFILVLDWLFYSFFKVIDSQLL